MNIIFRLAFYGLVVFNVSSSSAQSLPLVKSNSMYLDIRDGNNFRKGHWTIIPEAKPDIYYAQRSEQAKKIVFYTDIDSIAFEVLPDNQYDFIILLNGKDSCYTRISTIRKTYSKDCNGCAINNDTIPFTLGRDNKVHITGSINGSDPLDFMFDTGADQVVLYRKGAKKVKLSYDGKMENTGFGGTHTRDISNRNTLTLGKMIWKDEAVMFIDNQADQADGIIGFNIFENKVVEIDFDRWIMVIHNESYNPGEGYVKTKITYDGTLPQIPLKLTTGSISYSQEFVFDMGAGGGLFLTYPNWTGKEFEKLKVLFQSKGRGVGSGSLKSNFTLLPKLTIAGQDLLNVPMGLAAQIPEGWTAHNLIGMDILKRFNIILDYQQHYIYLKPNHLKDQPYVKANNNIWLWFVGGAAVFTGIVVAMLAIRKIGRRKFNKAIIR